MYRDYRNKDVQFFYVYKNLAHPRVNNFVPAFSIDERVQHIARAKKMMKTDIPWICDTMDNDVKNAFGGTYNGEFIIGPDGTLLKKRFWSVPDQLRKDLTELVGPSDSVTKVADLPTVFEPSPRKIAANVVPMPKLPADLRALRIEPQKSDEPYFAKLRVEASREFVRGAEGKLFLTMYLDPLYEVHWNNLAGKVKLNIQASEDAFNFEQTEIESETVKAEADVDPRWMMVKSQAMSKAPFEVTVTYVICDDAETFCKPVTQKYTVYPEVDRHGGSRPGIFLNGLFANVRELDKNGDQKLTVDELPKGQVTMYVGHLDYNGNSIVEFEEIDRFMKMFNNGQGVGKTNDGQRN